jgi:hypothetical protein
MLRTSGYMRNNGPQWYIDHCHDFRSSWLGVVLQQQALNLRWLPEQALPEANLPDPRLDHPHRAQLSLKNACPSRITEEPRRRYPLLFKASDCDSDWSEEPLPFALACSAIGT